MMPTPHSALPLRTAKARYIMIGGFLGAGKTTAVAALAQHLTRTGLRVGLITNDQGSELVDTAMLRARGFATEEIPGGCFCCRFNSLVDAAQKLTDATRPDVFIAEPVGSCTDLVATVTYPLRRIYGDSFTIAPLSVLVDPVRAERVLGLRERREVFRQGPLHLPQAARRGGHHRHHQDGPARRRAPRGDRRELAQEFPHAEILACRVRNGDGLAAWLELGSRPASRAAARRWKWTTNFTPKARRCSAG